VPVQGRAGVAALRQTTVLVVAALVAAACGAGGTGAATGSISGTVSVSVALASAQAAAPRIRALSTVRAAPAGAPLAVLDEVLVKVRPGASVQAAEIHRQAGAIEVKRSLRTGVSLVRVSSGEPLATVLARYRSDPRVAYAEPNYYRYGDAAPVTPAQTTPNDPLYPLQWHYANINLPGAWAVTAGSALVVVAVLDKGILPHPDLSGVTVGGFDFVDNDADPTPTCSDPGDVGHGTHVAGVIAALTNNSAGVAGVNWGGAGRTKIMPLRIFGPTGSPSVCATTSARIIDAIEYAADHSARVINMSFGGPLAGAFSQAEQDAVNYAYNTGVLLVASVGNSNGDCSQRYPAAYANVLGVAATTITNAKASYSNVGGCVDLAAPGGESTDLNGDGNIDGVLSTFGSVANPNDYLFLTGTSAAAPHVAGLAALLIARGVTGPAAIQNVMQSTAIDLGSPGFDSTFGAGLVDAASALGAPAATHLVRVFAGTIAGTTITARSGMTTVAPSGTYFLAGVAPGTWTVFAWQDTNGNGMIDGGDLYGAAPGVLVQAGGMTAGVNVAVTEVPLGTAPRTFAGNVASR